VTVKHALLGLLAERPRHGYELHGEFIAIAGGDGNWSLKPAQVYNTLERLAETGLVECVSDLGEGGEPSRRVYAITSEGRKSLEEWFASGEPPEHTRDSFYIKLMVSLVSDCGDPYRIIITQRSLIFQRLHAVTRQRNELDSRSELAQVLLMDKAIMHLEADLRWLEFVEVRLDEIKRQPRPRPDIRPRGRPRKIAD